MRLWEWLGGGGEEERERERGRSPCPPTGPCFTPSHTCTMAYHGATTSPSPWPLSSSPPLLLHCPSLVLLNCPCLAWSRASASDLLPRRNKCSLCGILPPHWLPSTSMRVSYCLTRSHLCCIYHPSGFCSVTALLGVYGKIWPHVFLCFFLSKKNTTMQWCNATPFIYHTFTNFFFALH